MGELLEPRAWCPQRWCRANTGAEHWPGDGCSCHAHGAEVVTDLERPITLTARAWRLDAFACRTCGMKTRNMVEYPNLFLRCQPCAAMDRWPSVWTGRIPRG